MVDVVSQKCTYIDEKGKCDIGVSYGFPDQKATRCVEHHEMGMISLKGKKCDKCPITKPTIATYGVEGQKPTRCEKHADKNMVDCTHHMCSTCGLIRSRYGYPGNDPIVCTSHHTTGMIAFPNKKCSECKEPAIYGLTTHTHCENHKEDGEYNLIEKNALHVNYLQLLIRMVFVGSVIHQ